MQCWGDCKWSKDITSYQTFELYRSPRKVLSLYHLNLSRSSQSLRSLFREFHSNYQILSRLQDKTSTFKGPMDVLKQVIRKEGPLGLYAGMESTFWRYIIDLIDLNSTRQLFFMPLQTGILERRIFRLHSPSQKFTSKTRCLCCAFSPKSI